MSFVSEFKEFAMRGNVLDLAVGVVIGGAFGKIVSSLVGDVVMPALSPVLGSVNFSDLAVKIATDAQTIFEFIIIAFSIFVVLKGINQLKRPAPPAANAPPPPPSKTEALLQEIRDLLAKK